MRSQIRADLASTLRTQTRVYADVESVRREQVQQSASFIAHQPSVKALMSTNDRLTVQDGSQWILPASHADLLILENPSGAALAVHAKSEDVTSVSAAPLLKGTNGDEDWWYINGHLYDVNLVPIVAGAGEEEHLLGRMALGREMRRETILSGGDFGKSAFTFERDGHVLLSSLSPEVWHDFESALPRDAQSSAERVFQARGERWLASFVELPGDHPVRLYCLQSFDQATSFLRELNRMLALLGAVAVLGGAFVTFLVSRQITRPIEQLVAGTRLLKRGDFDFQVPIRGSDEVAHLGRAFKDMRDSLKKSRESMLRAARLEAVGRLAGGIAHDFNNLVMIIKGYSDMLMEAVPPPSRPHLEEIKKAGDRASGLIRQLLAFSRKHSLEPQVLDPNQSVRNMVKMLRVLIGEDIELVTNLSDKMLRVLIDPGQLEQVIMNLAVNARDAMPQGGKLVIETRLYHLDEPFAAANREVPPSDYALITVTDQGCGMDKETLAHIFEPFFTTKELGKGTGLGLATVDSIVQQSQGYVAVESEVGGGTTFKVYLPSVAGTVSTSIAQKATPSVKGNGTILLVEDEPALRALAVTVLKNLGYTVLEAGSGVQAIVIAKGHINPIDVVVTDVVMPHMSGPELVEKLQETRQDFAVIFMSGYTDGLALERARIGTEVALLPKPFSTEELASKIQEVRMKTSSFTAKASASGF
ncbi:MAG TPA: ATP-binding protein [Candidatus Sulfotelmatobacter sp.]|nr:ATP-binding protein [Candidatus Sulfotelmatobacter sp.]